MRKKPVFDPNIIQLPVIKQTASAPVFSELVSAQPMSGPINDALFYMDFNHDAKPRDETHKVDDE